VKAGASVKINGNIKGVVTRVAGAIDPVTKKIEVRVGIVDENSNLVNGQSVRVEISQADVTSQSPKSLVAMIKVPLSAVKITPRDSYVFTLSASSTLQVVPVELGTLLGEEVEIRSGLTPDMDIVKDARGLKEGEKVATN
jgi:multidrug efflux pump subunit AcrA (membrane-fusion protein)